MSVEFKKAIDYIAPLVDKYKNEEFVEMEFRLGFIDNNIFDPSIPKEFYSKIIKLLDSNKKWTNKGECSSSDYFYNGKRLSIYDPNKKSLIKKIKLVIIDFNYENTPFDLRFCISKEIPLNEIDEFEEQLLDSDHSFERKKYRNFYNHKIWNYDVTRVLSNDNGLEETKYEFELEISDIEKLKDMDTKNVVYSSLLKIKDVVNCCEQQEDDEWKLKLLNEKIFKQQ